MHSSKLKVTVLGSGTSQGVPVIGCKCHICSSSDPKDNRLRSSILVEQNGKSFVVDSGPDFRQQMLRAKVDRLDGVLFTHEHKDHIAGLDDVRAYNFLQKADMPVYCTYNVELALRREFHYVFSEDKYPGIPQLQLHRIDKNTEFDIGFNVPVQTIQVMHYKMPVLGFRFGDLTYITDAKTVSKEEVDKIKGTRVLFVNALRLTEHISHFNLEEALKFIEEVKPEKAFLTHISHLFGTQKEIEQMLPPNVSVAYDGMVIEIE